MNALKLEIKNLRRIRSARPPGEIAIFSPRFISGFQLTVLLLGLFSFNRPVFPAGEANIPPPGVHVSAAGQGAAADKSPEVMPRRAGDGEIEEAPDARLRDPFWPIGFVPPGGRYGSAGVTQTSAVPEYVPEITSARNGMNSMLRIGGIIKKGDRFYATINGFTVQTGEVVSVAAEGGIYRFLVVDIDIKKVKLKPVKQ